VTTRKQDPGKTSTRVAAGACALTLLLQLAAPARGATFLDQVDRGKAALLASAAASADGAGARAAGVRSVIEKEDKSSPAFAIGASLAALDLDLDSDPSLGKDGDRALVEQQVRDLLRAQADAKIGNRSLCLLSGRANPRSLEAQIRLVQPGWTCGPVDHDH